MSLPARYTRTAATLHWLIAVAILVNLVLAFWANRAPDEWVRPMIDTHKSLGITVLGLVLLRILWRLSHKPPPIPEAYPPWERRAAHAAHAAIYVAILVVPLSGWMHDSAWKAAASHPLSLFYVVPWFRIGAIESLDPDTKEAAHTLLGNVHFALGYILIALLVLHIAGALKHQWLDGEKELQRIDPFAR
jgi:cytochrome b561